MGSSPIDGPANLIVISSSVGAGHNQAAAAVMEALKRAGAAQPQFIDTLEQVAGWFRLPYAGGYSLGVTRFPRMYGLGYRLADRPTGPGRTRFERGRLMVERFALRRFQRWLLGRLPAMVVATHYLAMPLLGRLVARNPGRLRMWAVVTDHEAHRFWYAENVEHYFVAGRGVAERLTQWGVEPDRITMAGIPIHPKWTDPLDAAQVYRRWHLPAETPIVLLSGGAYFTVGPVARIAQAILAGTDAHVVVLAGSNKKLLARLAGLAAAGRLTPVPFTDRVHELAEVASVIVTKAGGLITSECIAKGAAMVLTRPVPGQEAANARMLVREGAAVVAATTEDVIAGVVGLLARPADAQALRTNARRLYRPAAETIAQRIAEAMGGRCG